MKHRLYIFVIILAAVVTIAQSSEVRPSGMNGGRGSRMFSPDTNHAVPVLPSVPSDKAVIRDTISGKAGNADSLYLTNLDSLKKAFDEAHGGNPAAVQWNDSIAQVEDSIKKTKKKSPLEAPVIYEAKDSVVFFMGSKNAYLYGDGKVDYQNINLTAEQITMNMDSSIVHAVGVPDSLGRLVGKPVFKQGSDEYEQ